MQEERRGTETSNQNMYPWLLMVISFPSANWAQFCIGATAALLEIDLLGIQRASQPAARQSVNQSVSQSVRCSTIQGEGATVAGQAASVRH